MNGPLSRRSPNEIRPGVLHTLGVSLLLALAAGAAPAFAAGTTAGTVITNVAEATFEDPSTGVQSQPVPSNTVTATVLPLAAADFVYAGAANPVNNDGTGPGTADPNFRRTGVAPGQTVDTIYTLLNNGNIPNYTVTLNDTPLNNPSGVQVQYFLATDILFGTPLSTVTLPASGQVDIVQRVTVPANATPGTVISVSPYVTAPAGQFGPDAYAAVDETNNVNVPPTPVQNRDFEFTDIVIFNPNLYNGPSGPTSAQTPTTPSAPLGNVVVPPTQNAAVPTNPVSPPSTPADPSDPTLPGRVDVNNTSGIDTAITQVGNRQNAYPAYGQGKVTFQNYVATPSDPATPAQPIYLFPADAAGNPTGTYAGNGHFTVNTPNGPVDVTFTDGLNVPLPLTVNPANGQLYPTVFLPAGGDLFGYRTVVTQVNPSALTNPQPVVISVGADSGLDADATSNAATTDAVFNPQAVFGDVAGATADPALIGPGNLAQPVVPGQPAAQGAPNTAAATDSSAVFPMRLINTGTYNDTFTLSGSVAVPLADGTIVAVPVRYTDAAGTPLPTGTTPNTFISPLVAVGTAVTIYAVVDVPAGAAPTAGTPLIVSQTAFGNYSRQTLQDTNDQITVPIIGSAAPVKSVSPARAAPGQALTYTIMAKNNYNVGLRNYVVEDATGPNSNVFTYARYSSVGVTLNAVAAAAGSVVYSFNGGPWTTTPVSSIPPEQVFSVRVGLNTDLNTSMTANDVLPVGAELTETLVVIVR